MNTLSKEAEARILNAIQDVCELVNSGDSPTDAVVKVAQDHELTPNFIGLVCSGYNTGATTYQREKSSHIIEKLAEFPLANYEEALERIYPANPVAAAILKQSTAVSSDYSGPPKPFKLASATQKTEKVANCGGKGSGKGMAKGPNKAFNRIKYLREKGIKKRSEYTGLKDKLIEKLASFRTLVKHAHTDLSCVEFAAKQKYGSAVDFVFDYVAPNRPKLVGMPKRAEAAEWNTGVYKLVKEAMDIASACAAAKQEYDDFIADSDKEAAELLRPFDPSQNQSQKTSAILCTENSASTKQAAGFWGTLLGNVSGRALAPIGTTAMGNAAQTPRQLSDSFAEDLDDPDHENELRRIQARTMLQDMMMNDEVISGYDPSEIMNAYNELVGVTPRAATQPAIVRPMLRKRLTQGAIEPFEAAEMVNIEKSLGQTHSHQLGQAPTPIKEGSTNVLHSGILD